MDLTTDYLGLTLKNPIVPSSSPLSRDLGTIKALEDAGAAAIVMYSIFEEQLNYEQQILDDFLTQGAESFQEAITYFPEPEAYATGPEEYLEHIRKAKEACSIPIIASLNGVSPVGWIEFATKIQEAGADALELNVYYLATNAHYRPEEVERLYVEDLKAVKEFCSLPVAVKLSPFFTSISNLLQRLDDAGADAFVMFNRFYQPDFDLKELEVKPTVYLSQSTDLLLSLRWIAVTYGNVRAKLAATNGVHTHEDVLKVLMAGGDVAQMCSALLKNGPAHIGKVLTDLEAWMTEREYASVAQMKGSMSQKNVPEPAAFERANYMKALNEYKLVF